MTHALAVVAHFDDAAIWAGSAIRRTRTLGWEWTIVCTCAAEESRRRYFLEFCAELGARGIALEFIDHPDGDPFSRNSRVAMAARVAAAVGGAAVDWVFSHSSDAAGEYGAHPNHAEAAQTVADLIASCALQPRGVAQFAYRRFLAGRAGPPVAQPDASQIFVLDYEEISWKAAWCARARDVETRDPALGGRSWLEGLAWPCPSPEAFTVTGNPLPRPFDGW